MMPLDIHGTSENCVEGTINMTIWKRHTFNRLKFQTHKNPDLVDVSPHH